MALTPHGMLPTGQAAAVVGLVVQPLGTAVMLETVEIMAVVAAVQVILEQAVQQGRWGLARQD